MSLVVVGTDTGVGKTVVSALLLVRYGGPTGLAYWKPVATGSRDERDAETVARLAPGRCEVLPEAYLYRDPVSPHLAARRERRPIDRALLAEVAGEYRRRNDPALLVEGVGGLLVPFGDSGYLLADFLAELGLPCLLVARSTLGTLNHTFLTLEAARRRGLEVVAVVLVGPPDAENLRAIEAIGGVPVVAEVPPFGPPSSASVAVVAAEFDRAGRLGGYLGRGGAG